MFGPTLDEMTASIRQSLTCDPSPDVSVKFVLRGAGILLVKDGAVELADGPADLILTLSPPTLFAVATGRITALSAYMSGDLEIDDISRALSAQPKLSFLFSRIALSLDP
jgi:putative sterol carrier protein